MYRYFLLGLLCLSSCGGGDSNTRTLPSTSPPSNCLSVSSPITPVGISLLHLSQIEAREQVNEIVSLLASVCNERIALATLVDGSFSFDEPYLESVVAKLSESHHLSLILYLYNGSSQRRHDSSSIRGLFTDIPPERFRREILSSPSLRESYASMARSMLDLTSNAHSMGADVYWVVGLEDNLSNVAFRSMASILEAIKPNYVKIVRNPCSGCYPGNEDDSLPYLRERHGDSGSIPTTGGIVSNDGYSYDLDKLKAFRDEAVSKDNIFLYWRGDWQGLQGGYVAASKRNYARLGSAEMGRVKDFLERKTPGD